MARFRQRRIAAGRTETFLRHLIENHGLKRVYYEGLTDETKPLFEMKIEAYASAQNDAAEITKGAEEILAETDDPPTLRRSLAIAAGTLGRRTHRAQ